MQPNTITLNVDLLNDGNTTPVTYTRFSEYENRVVYVNKAVHTDEARDMITFYRSFPVKSGNFKGVRKTSVKITKDFVVPGVDDSTTVTAPLIQEFSVSRPVGLTAAQMTAERQLTIALADDDSIMSALNDLGEI